MLVKLWLCLPCLPFSHHTTLSLHNVGTYLVQVHMIKTEQ